MSELTGKVLGKYQLLEHLGQGGMAQVYRAYQPGLDRHVAIKLLHSRQAAEGDFSTSFRNDRLNISCYTTVS